MNASWKRDGLLLGVVLLGGIAVGGYLFRPPAAPVPPRDLPPIAELPNDTHLPKGSPATRLKNLPRLIRYYEDRIKELDRRIDAIDQRMGSLERRPDYRRTQSEVEAEGRESTRLLMEKMQTRKFREECQEQLDRLREEYETLRAAEARGELGTTSREKGP